MKLIQQIVSSLETWCMESVVIYSIQNNSTFLPQWVYQKVFTTWCLSRRNDDEGRTTAVDGDGGGLFFFNPNVTSFSAAARKQPRSDGRSRSSADNSVQSHPRSPGFLFVSWLDTNVTRRAFSASNDPYECCRFRSQTLSNQDDKMVIQIYKDKKCKFDKTTIFRKRVNLVFWHSKP